MDDYGEDNYLIEYAFMDSSVGIHVEYSFNFLEINTMEKLMDSIASQSDPANYNKKIVE